MSQTLIDDIEEIRALLVEKEQASGDLFTALRKARRRLPRRIFAQGQKLATALPLLQHPKLRLTLDEEALKGAAREVSAHLKTIDLAERRKDRLLGLLGSMAFSLLVVVALFILVLRWRGFV
ncbi:hypothetical protein PXK00_15370 [Phaeobacter sp. QD34_3]|uniref:hypothetical protein n=1 Tax=unclassified Phaeobacter TaxID=2621772 RepID=UPI00237FAC6F|nr:MULTISPECIES: hypothetical protein [unclassified Phaeobacter]MDE4134498.1 hypothetical protein [Phaeobacter sp. QD34_3]MDE4138112.1 hypothetical protein [Phaeobacter sp. QD34_24]MDE4176441.1 hypothetical protein [Phaeobacter sp. PT47_59]